MHCSGTGKVRAEGRKSTVLKIHRTALGRSSGLPAARQSYSETSWTGMPAAANEIYRKRAWTGNRSISGSFRSFWYQQNLRYQFIK